MINTCIRISIFFLTGTLCLSFISFKNNSQNNGENKFEKDKQYFEDSTLNNINLPFEGIELTAPVGEVIGVTTYGKQANSSIPRRVATHPTGKFTYATWNMDLSFKYGFPNRSVGFNFYDSQKGSWQTIPNSSINKSGAIGSPSIGYSKDRLYYISHKAMYGHQVRGLLFNYKTEGDAQWKTSIISEQKVGWAKTADDSGNIYCIAGSESKFCNVEGGLRFYRSLDNGKTWEDMCGLEEGNGKAFTTAMSANACQIDAANGIISIVYGGYLTPIILYKSSDNGVSWEKKIIQNTSNPLRKNLNTVATNFPPYTTLKYSEDVEDYKLEAYLRNFKEELKEYSVEPYFASKGNTVIIDSEGISHVVYAAELTFKNEKEDRGTSIDQAIALFYWNENMNTPEIIGETVLNHYANLSTR